MNGDSPAFPILIGLHDHVNRGITTRDYMAAKAMQAMCEGPWPDSIMRSEIAKRAYLLADAMLEARGK